ncbi:transcription initiation factor TFIID subunit 6-like [Euwallacea fornicatus]|uniref:transcription initiation factor TFIID subunit 6-like n=1 Tax=Euwallacea fornicatus TaxID=995702 RepID=UPI00338FB605
MLKKLDQTIKSARFRPKPDLVLINLSPKAHQLSKEEQMYFRKVTEAAFGYNDQMRNECFGQLISDYQVTLILPYLCSFIRETIHCNLVFTDLTLLIYAMRMTKSLLSNNHLDLKPYIHELLPAVLSCALAKKISKYSSDNHWALRDFSTYVVASICEVYSDRLNNMKERVVNLYFSAIRDVNKGLATTYGAIRGLSSFGEAEVETYLLPNVMTISNKIRKALEMAQYGFHRNNQKQLLSEAKHVQNVMVTVCAPILLKTRTVSDGGLSYAKEFGYLGKPLYIHVKNLESVERAHTQQAQHMQRFSRFPQDIGAGRAWLSLG